MTFRTRGASSTFSSRTRCAEQLAIVQAHRSYFDRLANAELQPFDPSCDVDVAASARVGNLEIYVPLRGLKEDLAAETARLAKLQERARKELAAAEGKLSEPRIRAQCARRGYGQGPGAGRRVAAGASQLATQIERLEKLR